MQDVRFAILGAGNIARAHLSALNAGEGVACVGFCDRIDGHAEKMNAEFGGGYRIFRDAREAVESPEVDAVILAVPNYQHRPLFELAAKNGKHILCEKPLTLTVEDGEAMAAAAETHGVKTQMGLCTRFEPYVEAMMDHVQAGSLGEIYFARTEVLRQRGAPTGWFGNVEKSGGGPLIDIGVHYIDACWYLMGKPRPVRAKALQYAKIPCKYPKNAERYTSFEPDTVYNVEDSTHGLITFDNGAGLMYQAAWSINAEDVDDRLEIYGSRGGLAKNPCRLYREEASGMTETALKAREGNCYTRQVEAFGRVIRGEEASRTPVSDGLAVQRMLNALYRSAACGREVDV